MDFKEQVARRRAELEQRERQGEADRRAAEADSRRAVVTDLRDELQVAGVPVRQDGEELALEPPEAPPLDVAALRLGKLRALRDREARRLWTPGENWLVISLITGGAALFHLGGFGFVPFLLGLWRRGATMKKYRAQVLQRHPELASRLAAAET